MNEHKEQFFKILSDEGYGICPAPMSAEFAIQVLIQYLLGESWYIAMPLSQEQANTEIVACILERYSKEYRKDLKRFKNEQTQKTPSILSLLREKG